MGEQDGQIGRGTSNLGTHGAAIPVFFIFFGKLIDEFGANYNILDRLSHGVSKYALYFVYLGLVILGAAWMEVACWTQTGKRQGARMRISYLRAMLKQDVGFFDTDTSTGEIVNGISSDTVLVQEAIGAKAGNYVHYMARFLSGFIVGFLCCGTRPWPAIFNCRCSRIHGLCPKHRSFRIHGYCNNFDMF